MITEETVEKAIDFLRFQSKEAAQAKANRIFLEEYRKTVKSNVMKQFIDLPLAAQEREAYASIDYKQHLEAMRAAIQEDEYHRWKMVAAQATLDVWRTQQANERGLLKA